MGCGKRTTTSPLVKTEDPKPVRALATTPGSAEVRDDKLVLIYSIKWKSAIISGTGTDAFQSTLKDVSGTIYKDGKPTTEYSADTGFVDRTEKLLTAEGRVHVKALPGNGKELSGMSMTSERMSYREGDRIIRAAGNVTIKRDDFDAGPFPELWCSNDLGEIATPAAYKWPRHNKGAK